jgi:hypothetical protein
MALKFLNDGYFAGKVGIGTPSLSEALEVAGSIRIGNGASFTSYQIYRDNIKYGDVGGGSNQFTIQAANNKNINLFDDSGVGLTVKDGGNVGIGTTGPLSKLQVAGGIQMADDTDTAVVGKVGTMRYRTGTEYVEVDGVELLPNFDLTNWTSIGSTTTITADTFTTVTSAGGVRKDSFLTVGQVYRAVISGTTTTTNNQINNWSNNSGYKSWSGAGAFNFTFIFTATTDTGMYLRLWPGTAEIYSLSVMEVTAEDASYADMCMQTGPSTYEWVNIVRNTY